MWIKRLVMFAITSGLAAKGLKALADKSRARRAQRERQQQRAEVQRWEDEGGSPRRQTATR